MALEHHSCGRRMGHCYPSPILSQLLIKHSLRLIFPPRTLPDIVTGLGRPQQQPWLALKIPLFRHWAGGRVQLAVCMSGWILITWQQCHRLCLTIYRGSPHGGDFHILFLLYMIVDILGLGYPHENYLLKYNHSITSLLEWVNGALLCCGYVMTRPGELLACKAG